MMRLGKENEKRNFKMIHYQGVIVHKEDSNSEIIIAFLNSTKQKIE